MTAATVQPSNDFQVEILRLHLLAEQPATAALRARLQYLLDDARPTYFSMLVVLLEQLAELLGAVPPEFQQSLAGWIMETVTERADCPR
jgi:hypothetical protein